MNDTVAKIIKIPIDCGDTDVRLVEYVAYLITKSVTTNYNRVLPARDRTGYLF